MNFQESPFTTALTSAATCAAPCRSCWSPASTFPAPGSPETLGGGTTRPCGPTAPTLATPTPAYATPSAPRGALLTTSGTATCHPSSAHTSGATTPTGPSVSIHVHCLSIESIFVNLDNHFENVCVLCIILCFFSVFHTYLFLGECDRLLLHYEAASSEDRGVLQQMGCIPLGICASAYKTASGCTQRTYIIQPTTSVVDGGSLSHF